jgi:hypothetical protein
MTLFDLTLRTVTFLSPVVSVGSLASLYWNDNRGIPLRIAAGGAASFLVFGSAMLVHERAVRNAAQAEQASLQRAEAERQNLAAAAEQKRVAAEAERNRVAAEAEQRRLAAEAEQQRLAAEASAQAATAAARAEAEKRQQEEIAAEAARTLAALKDRLAHVAKLGLQEQYDLYGELAQREPATGEYASRRDQLKPALDEFLAKREAEAELAHHPERFIKIESFSWSKEDYGKVMIASFRLKNTSAKDLKDFVIHCRHAAHSGTEIDYNDKTIYEIVKAGSAKTVRSFDMGFIHPQAATSGCEIRAAALVK